MSLTNHWWDQRSVLSGLTDGEGLEIRGGGVIRTVRKLLLMKLINETKISCK